MKNILLVLGLSMMAILSGCKKDAPATGPASAFVGTYVTANPVSNNGVTQVQVVQASDNTLKVVIKIEQFSYLYTASTLQKVTVSGTTGTISETQNIIEATDLGPYVFNGTVQINGDHLTLATSAISVQTPNNSDVSPMNFSFSGKKIN